MLFNGAKFNAMHEGKVVETGPIDRTSDQGGITVVRINDRWFDAASVVPA